MSTPGVTAKLAIRKLDTSKVPLGWLLKMVEGVLGGKILSLKKFLDRNGSPYCVAAFSSPADARKVYDYCDGLEIEDTHEVFDLAFVPDGMELPDPIEECDGTVPFQYHKHIKSRQAERADVEMDMGSEEEEKQVQPAQTNKRERETINLKDALDGGIEQNALDGFVFDPADDRLAAMLTDPEFALDASNRRFKEHREFSTILDAVRRRYDPAD